MYVVLLVMQTSVFFSESEDQGGSSNVKANRTQECSYGERCYRKNPAHFEEFEHSHCNFILSILLC